ncbi:MAG: hypothetical protein Q9224_000500 [Gallowayella concinna]
MVKGRQKGRARPSGGSHPTNNKGRSFKDHFVVQHNDTFAGDKREPTSNTQAFSLQDEARNTERTHSWNSTRKLRQSQVNFVSAGTSTPEEAMQPHVNPPGPPHEAPSQSSLPQTSLASMTIEDQKANSLDSHVKVDNSGKAPLSIVKHQGMAASERSECKSADELFFIDCTGSQVVSNPNLALSKIPRSRSPTTSTSSEEVIVFTGRRPARQRALQQSEHKLENDASEISHHRLREDSRVKSHEGADTHGPFASADTTDRLHLPAPSSKNQSQSPLPILEDPGNGNPASIVRSHRGRQIRQRPVRYSRSRAEEDEILADYIANMDDEDILKVNLGCLAHIESVAQSPQMEHVNTTVMDTEIAEDAIHALLDRTLDWDSDDIRDFDNLSTSSETHPVVNRVLSKRQRPTGEQYLVIGRHQSTDDARWISTSSMASPNARNCIRAFELAQAEFRIGAPSSEYSDSSDENAHLDADLRDDLDSIEDERDIVERRQARMTDEKIARLLSKQEELGLGSSELLLFDGDDIDEDEGPPPVAWQGVVHHDNRMTVKSTKKGKEKKHSWQHDMFSSTSLFAERAEQGRYGGFDVMDHDRLSLQKTAKLRRGTPAFGLSDSELEASLQSAFEKDRSKKKLRKKEREELRAQGLLGRTRQPNLSAKYQEGMTFQQIKDEVTDFMNSDNQSMALPSMAHKDRKMVHEIAAVLLLKSKSSGQGKARFPVLYKTGRTGGIDEAATYKLDTLLTSKLFFPRKDIKRSGKSAAIRRSRGNVGKTAGVSYHDGEVVGAAAPEIGEENRGRAMLEKMGWSKGTALGALNNKGMLQPVTHIVKTTKAGLG